MSNGLFLCIEGGDGSGKGTQHALLAEHVQATGQPFITVDFPRYGQPSAELVEEYLNGAFGDPTKLDSRLASVLFAVDRLAATSEITTARAAGKLVLANRFTASNMAHQGAKFSDRTKRLEFFNWLHSFEHSVLSIPEPDYHFILHVPAAIAQQRVLQKSQRTYTAQKLDGHEADLGYQQRAEQTYLDLADAFPDKFGIIECVEGDYEKTPEEIHDEIWKQVERMQA